MPRDLFGDVTRPSISIGSRKEGGSMPLGGRHNRREISCTPALREAQVNFTRVAIGTVLLGANVTVTGGVGYVVPTP